MDKESSKTGSKPLGERIREALGSLLGEGHGPPEAPRHSVREAAEAASRAEARDPSLFEEAVRVVGETLEHWRGGRSLLPVVHETGRDRIAAVRRSVELSVKIEALFRGGMDLTGRTVRFVVDGESVGEGISDDSGVARCSFTPAAEGVYPIAYEVVSEKGVLLRSTKPGQRGLLQVVGDGPVAAVDASLLFVEATPEGGLRPADAKELGELLEGLGRLVRRGWSLCYLDMHEDDRADEVRGVIERAGLPEAAVLVHPREELGFPTLAVDFAPLIAQCSARRMRAQGVPLVLAISNDARVREAAPADGVEVWTLADLAARSEGSAALGAVEGTARAFVRERDRADASEDARLTRALDLMSGSRLVEGNAVECHFDNREAREALFAAIAEARGSIHVQVYMLEEGRFAEHLAVRLIHRARKGVPVRIVVDALYSRQDFLGATNPVVRWLEDEPNIEVVASDPVRFEGRGVDALALKQRDHRKIAVVDGRVAFVSGRNAADAYYTGFDEIAVTDATPHERIPWLDAGVAVRGPLVAEIQRVFVANWHRNGGKEIARDESVFPRPKRAGRIAARVVSHEGIVDANALGAYEAILRGARDHVFVVNDFPVVSTLAAAIRQAVARGVRVTFLTGCALARRGDGSFLEGGLHRELFEYMSKRRFEPLLRAGVEAFEYQTPELEMVVARTGVLRPYVHAKVVTADGCVVSVGSANLDATASYWERELNVVVEDRRFAEGVEREIRAMIARSHRLDLDSEYWRREAAKRAVTDTLWPDAFYS